MSPTHSKRSPLIAASLAFGLLAAPLVDAAEQLRIGYQKSSTLISLLKSQGTLEKALADQDIRVSWHEFPNGQPLLEALNVGNIDLSADVADTVPVFAQAAGADLAYFAQEAPSPSAQAIIVREDSPITSLADLKGKKVAVTKAAGVHYLLIAALQQAGLKFSDIEPAYLAPADGRAAFENRKVDAWVTWEPFLSGDWLRTNPRQAAEILGPLWGNLAPSIVEQANAKRSYQVRLVQPESLAEQQKIADAFSDAGLLPRSVDTGDVVLWKPEQLK